MYWPNGVPRVYAVNGPDIRFSTVDDGTEGHAEYSGEDGRPTQLDRNGGGPRAQKEETGWANEVTTGLCVSRNGHMFATMTESSITVWQTKVRRPSLYWFIPADKRFSLQQPLPPFEGPASPWTAMVSMSP